MPELTPEQKEHLKMTHRANVRIEETWQIFNMYLADGKRPAEALELAIDAMEVWSAWFSQNEVEPPDIPHPDFGQQMADSMKQVFSAFPNFLKLAPSLTRTSELNAAATLDLQYETPTPENPLGLTGEAKGLFDAMTKPTPDTRTSNPNPAADPNSNTK